MKMPYCPNCREEYGEDISACVVCGSDLVDSLPDGDPDACADCEAVFTGPLARALELKALLEEEGCTVYLQAGEDQADAAGEMETPRGPARLFVPSDAVVEALELVDAAGEAPRPPVSCEDPCPPCNEDEEDAPGAGPEARVPARKAGARRAIPGARAAGPGAAKGRAAAGGRSTRARGPGAGTAKSPVRARPKRKKG